MLAWLFLSAVGALFVTVLAGAGVVIAALIERKRRG